MSDAPALHAAMSDAEPMRYWSTLPLGSLAETEAFVAATRAAVAGGEADDFVITLAGRVIGKAGLWSRSELGIVLSRDHRGRGYATEAIRAIAARAFARGIPQIDADVDPRNEACLTLLTRLCFRRIGEAKATYRLGDEWADSIYLALIPSR